MVSLCISISFPVSKSLFLYISLPFCIQFLHVSSWFIRSEWLLGLLIGEGGFMENVHLVFDEHSWFLAFEVSESGNSDACMGLEMVLEGNWQ
ncbi:hypothetical protein NC653_028405 [Populus alba x Populus x berolinensis]|uniref:Uncharacterized protein n=1 Tax=Populus alba x Populus x berolinensis TaxID=444605 RepID=A0AAD6M8P8_9ROSI|nr:hypothetical protein NC653_028397 [Populus alba x Populus x berolinensis]KAJ6980591.1 hypothetical protein NC653_028405 [Populus alba x Populus x berolinensis]